MTITDQLNAYHPDLISMFLETGACDGISKDVQLFIRQIQWGAELFETERNITRCAKKLQVRVLAQQGLRLDIRVCKARIYSAIEYFEIDCNVSMKVWESNFADRYENLATMCIAKNDYKTAKLCQDAAYEHRSKSSAIAETEKDWAPVFLINDKLEAEDLRFEKKNLKAIAKKHEEGFYIQMIDSLPIEKEEKERLKFDAQIIDIESEEIEE